MSHDKLLNGTPPKTQFWNYIRSTQVRDIVDRCYDPLVGKFLVKYSIPTGLTEYFVALRSFSNEELRKEHTIIMTTYGFLCMELYVQKGVQDPTEMSESESAELKEHCAQICAYFRSVDLDDPPELIKWLC